MCLESLDAVVITDGIGNVRWNYRRPPAVVSAPGVDSVRSLTDGTWLTEKNHFPTSLNPRLAKFTCRRTGYISRAAAAVKRRLICRQNAPPSRTKGNMKR